jgi:hypothetical protein
MAMILLTPENIGFIKSQLREQFPQIKSTHLSEAIAFSTGYRTHAALIAEFKAAPHGLPNLAKLSELRLSSRLRELGHLSLDVGNVDTICRSPNLPQKIWAVIRNGNIDASNHWFYECRSRNIPYLCIKSRRKYVELKWDCISIDTECEDHVKGDLGSDLARKMFDSFQAISKGAEGKPFFSGKSFTGSVDNLLPKIAFELADIYFTMLFEPMKKQLLAA